MPGWLRTTAVLCGLFAWNHLSLGDTVIATQTYTSPGAYTYTLPAGTTRVAVKVWGAGGNRSPDWNGFGGSGGGGGFVTSAYTATAGTVLNIRVGSAPGAASAVWMASGFQVIAAGGGSAGNGDSSGDGAQAGRGGAGGPSGQPGGGDDDTGGGGATQAAAGGGATNSNNASGAAGTGPMNLNGGGTYAANGGAGLNSVGSGGSGYYGGGGGTVYNENSASGGGGGGSNFLDTTHGYEANSGSSLGGDGATPAGTSDPHYSASVKYGQGADGSWPTASSGAVVIVAHTSNLPPVASFTVTPAIGRAPLVVNFDGAGSSDPGAGGGITAWAWDFDNNGSTDATGSTALTTYQNSGSTVLTTTARLTVTDNDTSAATGATTQTISVYPASSRSLTVQSGTITSAVHPFYQPGTAVSISANTPSATALFVRWVLVSGSGTFGSDTSSSITFTTGSSDTVIKATYGPTVPGAFATSGSTASSVSLSWTASTDDTAVTVYDLYRIKGGVTLLATSLAAGATSFTDTHVQAATAYGYFLKARDGDGNISNATATVTVTTPALADGDGDGLPDAFETLFGTAANANPSGESSQNLNVHRPHP